MAADALRTEWARLYGAPPPPRLGLTLLRRAVAHGVQEREHGRLGAVSRRRLRQVAGEMRAGQAPAVGAPSLHPGARLLREWHGVTHEVIVLETGVLWRGATWPSLSAVAREITGARWSGPLFFGLRKRGGGGGG